MPPLPLRGETACPYSYASAIPVSLFPTVRFPQLLIHVGLLPRGNDSSYTAEMAVGGCLLVDGTAQVKMLDDLVGSQTEALSYGLDQLFLICSAKRIDADGHGFGHTDGIGKLYLTPATDLTDIEYTSPKYFFDKTIYDNRVFDSHGVADPSVEIKFGPNIKDWPAMSALPENMVLKVVSEIHDPVTTTDELIPSGETSSYRSNPLGLAEFTLSRKDPSYVGKAKEIQKAQKAIEAGTCPLDVVPELKDVMAAVHTQYPNVGEGNLGIGSTIFAVKPGDGSAREQAASCQKVLGGWANIANEYATKRYRSNLINWGMLPFLIPAGDLPFANGDYLFVPEIRKAIEEKATEIQAYVVKDGALKPFMLQMGELTNDEREIILKGCLINYNRR